MLYWSGYPKYCSRGNNIQMPVSPHNHYSVLSLPERAIAPISYKNANAPIPQTYPPLAFRKDPYCSKLNWEESRDLQIYLACSLLLSSEVIVSNYCCNFNYIFSNSSPTPSTFCKPPFVSPRNPILQSFMGKPLLKSTGLTSDFLRSHFCNTHI